MKSFCVAVIVLNFLSVCQSSSVACERFLKPAVKDEDLSGKWYVIAMSSNSCWAAVMTVLPWSMYVDITAMGKPNLYQATIFAQMYGRCQNGTTVFLFENGTIFEVNNKGVKVGEQGVFLQRRCHDCITFRVDGSVDLLGLLSRRKTITAEEMETFEIQADCRSLYKPHTFGSNHDYENCTPFENDRIEVTSSERLQMQEALGNMFSQVFTCLADRIFYYPRTAYQWMQQTWDNLW